MATLSIVIPSFEAGARTAATVEALLALPVPPGMELEIVVVDDGSSPAHAQALAVLAPPVRVHRLPRNAGRGNAINAGAQVATGAALLILDADCPPADASLLSAHADALADGAEASIGRVLGRDDGFWGRYQGAAARRRESAFRSGDPFALTSANVAIARALLLRIGFDPAYGHYGFEDRDWFLRLRGHGAGLAFTDAARVVHDDPGVSLASVARKMREAGRHTSGRFRAAHPAAYAQLGFARADARDHPVLARLVACPAWVAGHRFASLESLLAARWLPFALRRALARAVIAGSYAAGTLAAVAAGE